MHAFTQSRLAPIRPSRLLIAALEAFDLRGDPTTPEAAKRQAAAEEFALYRDNGRAADEDFDLAELDELEMVLSATIGAAQCATGRTEVRIDFDGLAEAVGSPTLTRIVLLRMGIFPRADDDGRTIWASCPAGTCAPSAYVMIPRHMTWDGRRFVPRREVSLA